MSEVRVLFMGRECFEALSHDDCQHIYDKHQKTIIEKAKHNFQVMINLLIIRENNSTTNINLYLNIGVIIRTCRSLLPFQKYSTHRNHYSR